MNPIQRFAAFAARIADSVRIRHLGLGFVWAWVYCAWETPLLFDSAGGLSINADSSWLISAVSIIATLFFGAALWRNRRPSHVAEIACAAAVLAAAGTVACAASSGDAAFGAVAAGGAAATGVGIGLLYLLWAGALGELDQESIEVAVPLCAAVPVVFTLVPLDTPHSALSWAIVALLPVLSALLLLASSKKAAPDAGNAADGLDRSAAPAVESWRKAAPVLVRLGASLAISFTVVCFLSASIDAESLAKTANLTAGIDVSTLSSSLLGIVLAMGFVAFAVRIDFVSLYRWLLPLVAFAIAASSACTPLGNTLSLVAQSMANVALETIAFIYFLNFSRRNRISPVCCMGLMWGCCQVGILAGNLMGSWTLDAGNELFVSAMPWLAFALVLGAVIVPPRAGGSAFHPHDAARGTAPHAEEDPFDSFADRHGLTEREREICALLIKGRSLPYIRDQLFLSKNTVATHAKHIYKKLDVHSKQELLDAYESEQAQ